MAGDDLYHDVGGPLQTDTAEDVIVFFSFEMRKQLKV